MGAADQRGPPARRPRMAKITASVSVSYSTAPWVVPSPARPWAARFRRTTRFCETPAESKAIPRTISGQASDRTIESHNPSQSMCLLPVRLQPVRCGPEPAAQPEDLAVCGDERLPQALDLLAIGLPQFPDLGGGGGRHPAPAH